MKTFYDNNNNCLQFTLNESSDLLNQFRGIFPFKVSILIKTERFWWKSDLLTGSTAEISDEKSRISKRPYKKNLKLKKNVGVKN